MVCGTIHLRGPCGTPNWPKALDPHDRTWPISAKHKHSDYKSKKWDTWDQQGNKDEKIQQASCASKPSGHFPSLVLHTNDYLPPVALMAGYLCRALNSGPSTEVTEHLLPLHVSHFPCLQPTNSASCDALSLSPPCPSPHTHLNSLGRTRHVWPGKVRVSPGDRSKVWGANLSQRNVRTTCLHINPVFQLSLHP